MSTDASNLKLRYFTEADFDKVMRFLIDKFISTEPLSIAIGFKEEDAWTITAESVKEALPQSYCCGFVTPNDDIAAVRICQAVTRPETAKTEEQKKKNDGFTDAAQKIALILDRLGEQIWDKIDSDIKQLMVIHIICTDSKYRRRGLCQKLLLADLDRQKKSGIQGCFTEATAFNSQQLFAKLGYSVLAEISYDSAKDEMGNKLVDKLVHQTKTAQLVYKKYS